MDLDNKFSALQLSIINDQAALYACACPLQVSLQIASLRKLFDYQKECIASETSSVSHVQIQVHHRIAEATKIAHQIMEQCLDDILDLEGWDRTNIEMPPGIRKRIEIN
jgi:SPX domain protein involved in polyphosphate accumulation